MIGPNRWWSTALTLSFLLFGGCAVSEANDAAERDIGMSDALANRDGTPELTIVSPTDGATVTSPLLVEVEPTNFTLSPSGKTVDGQGHVHLLIDRECYEPGAVIPDDSANLHAGSGARRITTALSPGTHRLCLQISDGFHVAVAILDEIEVVVVANTDVAGDWPR